MCQSSATRGATNLHVHRLSEPIDGCLDLRPTTSMRPKEPYEVTRSLPFCHIEIEIFRLYEATASLLRQQPGLSCNQAGSGRKLQRMSVDAVDRKIIAELSLDSRLSVSALADRIHISRTAAHSRIQNLVRKGVLSRFGAEVNRKAIDLQVSALVIVKIAGVPWTETAAALSQLPFVEKVQAVSGDIDFVLMVCARDNEHLSEVILRQIYSTPGVVSTRSHVILDEVHGTPPALMLNDVTV